MRAAAFLLLGAITQGVCASQFENFVEGGFAYTSSENELQDETDDSNGAGLAVRGRAYVEGSAFLQFDAQASFTSGDVFDTDYDLDFQLYRVGLGAAGRAGEGDILSTVWAEVLHGRAELDVEGLGSEDADEWGGGAHVRFDRFNDRAVFLPYLQLGYLILEELRGPEVKLGFRLAYESWVPYAEVQYLDLDADSSDPFSLSYRPITFNIGVRLNF